MILSAFARDVQPSGPRLLELRISNKAWRIVKMEYVIRKGAKTHAGESSLSLLFSSCRDT